MTTESWPSPMKASRRSNSSSNNIIAFHHRKLDPSTAVLRVLMAAGYARLRSSPDGYLLGPWAFVALALAISFTTALFTYHWFEKPLTRYVRHFLGAEGEIQRLPRQFPVTTEAD